MDRYGSFIMKMRMRELFNHPPWRVNRRTIMLLLIRIHPSTRLRLELLAVLRGVTSQTAASPGCISVGVYEGIGNDDEVLYMERWSIRDLMIDHIRSALFTRVLLAMEMSESAPEFVCYEIGQEWGMELIEDIGKAPS